MASVEIYNKECTNQFSSIDIGDIFIYDEVAYIKISQIGKHNAVDLNDGLASIFDDDVEIPAWKHIKVTLENE